MLINVLDYGGNVTAALAAAQNGDRIYIPSSTVAYAAPYDAMATGGGPGWVIDKSLEIFGDGAGPVGNNQAGTTLLATGIAVFTLRPASDSPINVFIHDLKLSTNGTGARGIDCSLIDSGNRVDTLRVERVRAAAFPGVAYNLDPGEGSLGYVNLHGAFSGSANGGYGYILSGVEQAALTLCGGYAAAGSFRIVSSSVALNSSGGQGDAFGGTGPPPTLPPATQGSLYLEKCPIAHVESCWFEDAQKMYGSTIVNCIGCAGAVLIAATSFLAGDSPKGLTGLQFQNSDDVNWPCGAICILPNNFSHIRHLDGAGYDCV